LTNNYDDNKISLKGTGGFLKLVIPADMEHDDLWRGMEKIIEEAEGLLSNVGIIVDFNQRNVTFELLSCFINDFILKYDLKVGSWLSKDTETLNLFRKLALKSSENDTPAMRSSGKGKEALIIKNSLRSGQRIEHHGDVIVIGHVNDGAEILATGNISVFGKLKGLLHAGYESDEENVITCNCFEAKQVRLGGKLSTVINHQSNLWGKPVIISLEKDSLHMREIEC